MVGSPQPMPEGEFESRAAVKVHPVLPTHLGKPRCAAIKKLSWGSGPSWCFTQSNSVFSRGVESCYCCCWSGVKSSLELLENWKLVLSLLTHHKTVLFLPPVPDKSEPFHLASTRTGLCAIRNQIYGWSHGKPFGDLLKMELGPGLVSSRMREGNLFSLFVV